MLEHRTLKHQEARTLDLLKTLYPPFVSAGSVRGGTGVSSSGLDAPGTASVSEGRLPVSRFLESGSVSTCGGLGLLDFMAVPLIKGSTSLGHANGRPQVFRGSRSRKS